jgi:hypothetical protein
MANSDLIAVHRVGRAGVSSLRELVQARADDVVLAAALCKPNAAGLHEFSRSTGFGQRQMLKARGAYLGERIVLGVTPLHVHAVAVFLGSRISRAVACWPIVELHVEPISPNGRITALPWPAVLLTNRFGKALAELQVLQHDDDAWDLLALLLGRTTSPQSHESRSDNCDH